MKKNYIAVFLLYAAGMLFISGCKPDKEVEPKLKEYLIPQEIKDYALFKPNTYWIYKEQTSGIEDSVFVISEWQGKDTLTENGLNGIYEWFEVKTISSLDGYTYVYWVHMSYSDNNPKIIIVWREKYKNGDYVGQTILMTNTFVPGLVATPYTQDGDIYFIESIEQLQIEGYMFSDVKKLNDTENITESKNETNFYIAKNYGIIKKELVDSVQVWNLVRFNIVQ